VAKPATAGRRRPRLSILSTPRIAAPDTSASAGVWQPSPGNFSHSAASAVPNGTIPLPSQFMNLERWRSPARNRGRFSARRQATDLTRPSLCYFSGKSFSLDWFYSITYKTPPILGLPTVPMFKRFLVGMVLLCGCASGPVPRTPPQACCPPTTYGTDSPPPQGYTYPPPTASQEPSCLEQAMLGLGVGFYFLTGIGGPPP
jgi:hypothetical protein